MSDAFWNGLFQMLTPVMLAIVAGWFGRKLHTIEKQTNSMLSITKAQKDEADKKLETNLLTQLAASQQEVAALKEKVALLTPPPKDK